jgi:ABC-type phosphate/phosphonate transport system ATPase subunit
MHLTQTYRKKQKNCWKNRFRFAQRVDRTLEPYALRTVEIERASHERCSKKHRSRQQRRLLSQIVASP